MWVYATGLCLSLMFAYWAKRFSKRGQRFFFCVLSMLPLTLIAAIRYDVGTDYFYTYAPGFTQYVYQYGMRGEQFEGGFQFLQRLLSFFTNDYAWLFAVTAAFFGILSYYNIFHQSENALMSIFLYIVLSVYFSSLNMVRQSLAMAIAYLGMRFIDKKKPWAYIGVVLFASLFHASLLIMIPVFWLSRIRWNRKKGLLIEAIGIMSGGLIAVFAKWGLQYIRGGLYLKYLEVELPRATWSLAIALVLFALVVLVGSDDWRIWFAAGGNLLVSVLTWYIPLMSRISSMFAYALMLYYPMVLDGIRKDSNRWQVKTAFVLCFSAYIYITISGGGQGVLPYQTIFGRLW